MLDDESRIGVHMVMKVGLPGYSSAECDVMLSNLRMDTTPEEIDQLLEVGRVAYDKMKVKLAAQVMEIKRAHKV